MSVKVTAEQLRRLCPDLDLTSAGLRTAISPEMLARTGQPVAVAVERREGMWSVTVANWCPISDNLRAKGVKPWHRGKKRDRQVVREWLGIYSQIPPATGRRRLDVRVGKKGPLPDGANLNKSLRDALVSCRLLVDDSAEWLEGSDPVVTRAKVTATTITLTDLA